MLQKQSPNPLLYYTTKLWICQLFSRVYCYVLLVGIVTFVCYVFGGNVAQCYVTKK